MSLAENLRRIREGKGMSQAHLAKAAGVSQQSISQLERGIDLTSKHLPRIAKALGVSIDALDENYNGVVAKHEPTLSAPPIKMGRRTPAQISGLLTKILKSPPELQDRIGDLIETELRAVGDQSLAKSTRSKSHG